MEPSVPPWRTLEAGVDASASTIESRGGGQRWMAPRAAVLAVAALAVAGVAWLLTASGPGPVAIVGSDAGAVAAVASDRPGPLTTAAPGRIVVHVAGAVRRPGLVTLTAGARVADAIEAAGGFGPRIDAARADRELNLAAPVKDGERILVPSRDDAGEVDSPASSGQAASGSPVDLNHASAEVLDTLPGIGPATAAKIIAAREERPFRTLDELVSRKVLGAATLAKIRALVELR